AAKQGFVSAAFPARPYAEFTGAEGSEQARRDSGEHRLPACRFRQLAENLFGHFKSQIAASRSGRRQAADDCRLAPCAPLTTNLRRAPTSFRSPLSSRSSRRTPRFPRKHFRLHCIGPL